MAIEQSTDVAGIALLEGRKVLAFRDWKEERIGTRLFDAVSDILDDAGLDISELDAWAVGLGPGSYTGLRISLAAAMAFALPDRRMVYGLNSAEPLADSIMEKYSCEIVFVIGDARRGRLWVRGFQRENDRETTPCEGFAWRLVKPEELRDLCPPASVCVTSDWERIGSVLERAVSESVVVIREKCVPSARALGRLAAAKIACGVPSEPLIPIYLNPAVAGNPGTVQKMRFWNYKRERLAQRSSPHL